MRVEFWPGRLGGGPVQVPPSKSISHRMLLCAALAAQPSLIQSPAYCEDVNATLDILSRMGAAVQRQPDSCRVQAGAGSPAGPLTLDCGESGSTLRFLIPLLGCTRRPVRLVGHGRLPRRPLAPYAEIFHSRGLLFEQSDTGVRFCGPLTAGDYRLPGHLSSQFVSGLLLALPLLKEGDSRILLESPLQSAPYVTLTRQIQREFGVETQQDPTGRIFRVPGGQQYRAHSGRVPGDHSQAAVLGVLGALCGPITLRGLSDAYIQPDSAIWPLLCRCGADLRQTGGELTIRPAPLRGFEADLAHCPDLGPILMTLALFCAQPSTLRNAGRLRLKESDRIAAMQQELQKLGGRVEADADTVTIYPGGLHPPRQALCGQGDHRVVMALTAAVLGAGFSAQIQGAEAIGKSWPDFFETLHRLNAPLRVLPD